MLEQNTRESALRREEFHRALRVWLDDSFDDLVGDPGSHAGTAWLWVRHGGDRYYLQANSRRAGIRQYINLVEESKGDPDWALTGQTGEDRERVAIGRNREMIDGFEFYRHASQR